MNDILTGNRCLCRSCREYFSTVTAFDRHQRSNKDGTTRCLNPTTVGLIHNGRFWAQAPPKKYLPNWVGSGKHPSERPPKT